jgi:large subunit ribosomal protein L10
MNRDQKAVAIAEIATDIEQSQAVFAVDYRGLSVAQAAELRAKLRDADATLRVIKNSLTERAADQTGTGELKPLLQGPTALTFVRGDAALAAKAIADYARLTQLLPFKGGLMDGAALDADQLRAISRLPSREVLYGQLVGVVAFPITGLVRTLGALVGGLAVALGQVREKKESGELPAGEAPASAVEDAPTEEASAEAPAPAAEETPEGGAAEAPAPAAEETPEGASAPAAEETPEEASVPAVEETSEEASAEAPAPENQTEPATEPTTDDNQADASAEAETAEANPKED